MDDLISRQEVLYALKGLPTWWADKGGYYGGAQPPMVALLDPEDAVSAIENLPSAQPEIIRCKDCRWGRKVCGNIECFVDINVTPEYHGYEWYCPNGERRKE